ncbi:hypothetical protein P5G65_31585 [Paenibacillus chondroitinus]|uniref:Uncharacterized protein n=1 Tax=Paenibacillus chondroitinus TaxID=59842 RepID=A0ABU6DL52_9BACL|nr:MULTISPECIES: CBO0543 family protein [Paenibacillus]MCY9657175.1 hypothetical protein [Paenibacillus anseongense]MEB4798458.1 hypothetical protein [Paenibacillus chondroitinus]
MEYMILWFFFVVSLISIFFWIRKQPIKDWIIVFFLKAFLSGFVDSFIVAYKLLEYPIRPFPEVFQIEILFDLMVFPILCVFYNQTSYNSGFKGILLQAILYSLPMSAIEYWGVKNTRLIVYHHWNIGMTSLFLVITFLMVRGIIALIRKYSKP